LKHNDLHRFSPCQPVPKGLFCLPEVGWLVSSTFLKTSWQHD